jgi:hypothetical protein
VTTLDWVIVAVLVLAAPYGYRQGFIVAGLSLAGFALGAFLATRLGAEILTAGSRSPYAPLFGLLGALLAGAVVATVLEAVGLRIRSTLRLPGAAVVDGLLGVGLTAALGLGLAWIAGAVVLHAPGTSTLRRDVQRSEILRRLNDALPPSGAILNALARLDPLPRLARPVPGVPPPTPAIGREPAVRRAAAGVVQILGTACGLGVEGSGWVARPGVVVTNAHVVAGQDDTVVEVAGEPPGLRATVIGFFPRNDLAVLRVDGLRQPALPLAGSAPVGTAVAILGYPRNGPYRVRAGRIGRTDEVLSQDAYGRGPVLRAITPLRGVVQPGNSGGPIVDGRGRVMGTVFAAATSGRAAGGFAVPVDVIRGALERSRRPVGSGPCA